ncbi:hypothetical protein BJI67_12955 [Acidihalobacter aeolianus]|uniref:Outer membrane protein beta-barrel domain-containing protein n=1 Tax=Acidihalobacter aeolianus TaxID=2792603 RepID=A0A1D8KA76_9GAMM|nr:hypothetical protein [Acidihalobacter aeolianus]AOV17841.1 hypothetical protein BJI67_12955 [Acidihalobacter aeolianus]
MFRQTILTMAVLGGAVICGTAQAGLFNPMNPENDGSRLGFQRGNIRTDGGSRTQISGVELDGGRVFAGGYGVYDSHVSILHGSSTSLFSGRFEVGAGFSPLPHLAVAPILAGQYDLYGTQGVEYLLLRGGVGLKLMIDAGPVIVTLTGIDGHVGKAAASRGRAMGGLWDREAARIGFHLTPFVAVYAKYSRDRFGLNGARITSPVATVGIRLGG